MKHIASVFPLLIITALFFTACKEKRKLTQVNISLQNNPETQVVSLIGKAYGTSAVVLDTATITAGNSSCRFETLMDAQSIYSVRFEKDSRYILFSNDIPVIHITANWNDFSAYSTSSPASASLKGLLVTFNNYLTAIDTLKSNSVQSETDSLKNIWSSAAQQKTEEAKAYLVQYTDTAKSPAVALYALGILQQKNTDPAVMTPLISRLANRFEDNDEVKKIGDAYSALLSKQMAMPGIGKMAPVFSLPDTAGQMVTLESFRGKYTLVDFWASWCGPCRKENPSVVAAFNAYKDKNFTILGVSLDKDKAAWLNAIHKDGLTWQQVSDLKEWESMVVPLYAIEGIPYNVLLDPGGKIIAMNLRGDALGEKLAAVLDKAEQE
ncbi:TlpA disulfide reductase family protein [Agriterribacter sp.]|uniref:TlpA family protein disulfide reductase n=1 Tax=Agriterribacter sp. TaxID=2821509 RepID=UPI002CF3A419|nr:TlpA disulfide reductase family protein [Agriterribacter sp.]HTN05662.1 TlpA disulfide reductase family protein [Agriterribacter sp.]